MTHLKYHRSMGQTKTNKPDTQEIEPGTIPLWPDTGRRLRLGRAATYDAYHRGDLPVPVIRIGKKLLVPKAALDRLLA